MEKQIYNIISENLLIVLPIIYEIIARKIKTKRNLSLFWFFTRIVDKLLKNRTKDNKKPYYKLESKKKY